MWPLTWVALIPLFLALRQASAGRAFLLGWWTETVAIWLGFHWLIGTMVHFGYIPLPMSLVLFGLMGIGTGVRLGLFTWWLRCTTGLNTPWWYRLLLPACAYVTLDYLYPRVFPWLLGMLQFPATLLIQVADLTGVHGITFLLVVGNTTGASWLPYPGQPTGASRRRMCLVGGGLLILSIGYGLWRLPQVSRAMQQAPTLRLALIQPNIGIHEKGQWSKRREHLLTQIDMSHSTLSHNPDLIIWPETMYPYTVPTSEQRVIKLPPMPPGQTTHWLIGSLTFTRLSTGRQVFNSALLVGPDAHIVGRYDKQILLAFGEYIPLQRYLPFLRHISPTIGNLTPGSGSLVTLPRGVAIGSLICYEDIFPSLGRQAVRQGAQLLVNLTNDAWFGHTRAPYTHRMLAAFRAVENRVYLVRSTNTGLTSIIDPLGREQVTLPLYQRRTLVHTLQPLRLGTVYTRFGDWFAQLCSTLALLLSLWWWWQRR
ncbi:Apolipoprotein N-acyltransferase [Candidatus Entotheonellaceae bacterium PAL068K]